MKSKHTSSFWRGFGSIVGANLKPAIINRRCVDRTDIDRLAGDFARVGSDIETAIEKVDRDVRESRKSASKK